MTEPSAHPVTDLFRWLAADDARALCLTLYGEARSEPIEGRIAVASVIRNRAQRHYRGASIQEVCLWPGQFSCWTPRGGTDNYAHLSRVAMALAAGELPPWSPRDQAIYEETQWVADGIVSGAIRDRVRGATHYCTERLYETKPPKWAIGYFPIATVGAHVFFRNVP